MPVNAVNIGGSALFRHLQLQIAQYLVRRTGNLIYEDGTLIPVAGQLSGGERTVVQPEVREFGEASISAPGADDIPMVEIAATETEYRVFKTEAGFSITYDEQMAYDMAASNGLNIPVYDVKFAAALRVIRERLDRAAAFGNTELGFRGLVNNANVPVSDETATNVYDDSVDAYTLREFMLQPTSDIDNSTEAVEGESANVIVVSSNFYNLLERRMLVQQGISVLQSLRAEGRTVVKSRRLNGQQLRDNGVFGGGTTTERFIVMPRDVLTLNRRIKAPSLYPADYVYSKGNRKVYPMFALTTETMINYPASMRYVNYATA